MEMTPAMRNQAARIQREVTAILDEQFIGREWHPRTGHILPKQYEEEVLATVFNVTSAEADKLNSMTRERRVEFAAVLMTGDLEPITTQGLADARFRVERDDPYQLHMDVQFTEPINKVEISIQKVK